MTFLVPLAFAVTVPVGGVTGRLTWQSVVVMIGFTIVLLVVFTVVLETRLRRYGGASA